MDKKRERNQNGKCKWLSGEEKDESHSNEALVERNECIISGDGINCVGRAITGTCCVSVKFNFRTTACRLTPTYVNVMMGPSDT